MQRKKKKVVAVSKKAKTRLENKMGLGAAHLLHICQSTVQNMRYEKMQLSYSKEFVMT